MTKIFWGNQYVTKFNCDGKRRNKFQKFVLYIKYYLIQSAKVCIAMWILMGAFQAGARFIPQTPVYAEKIVEVAKEVPFPPALQKICNAETTGNKNTPAYQFKKNGDVLRGRVTPSDIGYCQISEIIWNDTARKLGYDIYTEKGNKDMALWLFMNYGNQPWYLSEKNWSELKK